MRTLAYILIVAGFLMVARAFYQEYRGVTTNPGMVWRRTPLVVSGGVVTKEQSPEAFRQAMTIRWFYAGAALFSGVILYMIVRGQDRTDPLSPDFDWKEEK